jgi:tetratricopeptide (TPR) repeat protein
MVRENARLLLQLYVHPKKAMSGILDEGNWLFGAVTVVLISVLLQMPDRSLRRAVPVSSGTQIQAQAHARAVDTETEQPPPAVSTATRISGMLMYSHVSVFATLALLGLIYVPANLMIVSRLESLGGFGTVFYRDYASLLACTLMSWTAAHLPIALARFSFAALHMSAVNSPLLPVIGYVYFGGLMICALGVVFGARAGSAAGSVGISWLPSILALYFYNEFGYLFSYLASPFFLFYGYRYISGDIHSLGRGLQNRQSFRRHLEASTINPNDAEAHVQLGLIYEHRRQYAEATARFERAIQIDPTEVEAHFHLGRIARQQGRLEQALVHLQTAAKLDPRHSSHEVWREIGTAELAASNYSNARVALERYTGHREYDPEGLYIYGQVMQKLGELGPARDAYERCLEAVKTMPSYRRGQVRTWGRLAQGQLRTL